MNQLFFRLSLLAIILFGIAGCGFQLRGDYNLPFTRLYLVSNISEAAKAKLQDILENNHSVKLVYLIKDAEATLNLSMVRERKILTLRIGGVAQEYELTTVIHFSLVDTKNQPLAPANTFSITRTMTYSDRFALAKDNEAEILYQNMEEDLVNQILRYISLSTTSKTLTDNVYSGSDRI